VERNFTGENSRSSTDSVTPHHHELRLRSVSQPLLVTVDQAILSNLSSVYLFYFSPPLFSFYPFNAFNLFKSLYHTYFSVVPYWRRLSSRNVYGY